MRIFICLLSAMLLINFNHVALAKNFYLDSNRNKGTLRFELDNDIVWNNDSNFTNGWSIQYHTVRYKNWEEVKEPSFVKWVGKHFPTLDKADSIVRNSHGIGQNMITPGNLNAEVQQKGDLPYAGTLTYSLSWQSFNRQNARILQMSIGVLGEPSLSEQFQKYAHNDLGLGDDPKGWDTQRDTEPILNFGYQYALRVAHRGHYNDGWAGQLVLAPSAALGNLFTAAELILAVRFGWNIVEGFNAYPAPPGRGLFQASYLPKPQSASPHGFEVILGVRGTGMAYSVIYDGSIITGDDRSVDRNNFFFSGGAGIYYHYHDFFSIRATIEKSTDILKKDSIPYPPPGRKRTEPDVSYGSLIIGIHF
jgi:lipid A 3-O-deacylase